MTRSENRPVPLEAESLEYRNEPKTLAECLDAAKSGEEFGQVLTALFGHLESTRHRGPGASNRESE